MRTLPTTRYTPFARNANGWQICEQWMYLSQPSFARLTVPKRELILHWIGVLAQSRCASQLIPQLEAKACRRPGKDIEMVVLFAVIVVGSLTFSVGMRIIAASLGAWALPLALIGGGLASGVVDRLAVPAHTNRQKKVMAQNRLATLQQRRAHAMDEAAGAQPGLERFYKAQIDAVLAVEGQYLQQRSLPTLAIFAGLLSLGEFAVALWMVSQATMLVGMPFVVKAIAATIPVVLTHAAAAVQSVVFGVPDHAKALLLEYRHYLAPSADLTEAELHQWLLTQDYQQGCVGAVIENLLTPNTDQPIPALAELAFEIDYFQQATEQLTEQAKQVVLDCWTKYEMELAELGDRFPAPELNLEGLSDQEIQLKEQALKFKKAEWVTEQRDILNTRTQSEVERITADYSGSIQTWQTLIATATAEYEQQRCAWNQRVNHH